MRSDNKIQKDVLEELKWQPYLKPSEIGVSVVNGVVTLSGQVDSYLKKVTAERAARKIAGVKAIAEDIHVGISPAYKRTDTEIATMAVQALKAHSAVPHEHIKIKVEDGIVRLTGQVEWPYQRMNAKSTVEQLYGVRAVIDHITIKPKPTPTSVKQQINKALKRSADVNSDNVSVEVKNGFVKLTGTVRSIAEKSDAEQAAWNAPGVLNVENNLEIKEPVLFYD